MRFTGMEVFHADGSQLQQIGIQPHILLCRCDREIPREERRKLALFCNVREGAVIDFVD